MKLGNTDIQKVYLGSSSVQKVYLGTTLIKDFSGPAAPTYEAETDTYIARVGADGGTVGDAAWTDEIVKLLKAEGVWATYKLGMVADGGVKVTGSAIDKIYNLAPSNAGDAVVPSTFFAPQLGNVAGVFNTRRYFEFNVGSDQQRISGDLTSGVHTQSLTLYLVVSHDNTTPPSTWFGMNQGAGGSGQTNRTFAVDTWNTTTMEIARGDGSNLQTMGAGNTSVTYQGDRRVICVKVEPWAVVIKSDVNEYATGIGNDFHTLDAKRFVLGGTLSTGEIDEQFRRNFTGQIAEVHLFSGEHTNTQRANIVEFLRARYRDTP